jgi:hypothetical protein
MKRLKFSLLLALLFASFASKAHAEDISGPFDRSSLEVRKEVKNSENSATSSSVDIKKRQGVFCGMINDIDQLFVCVDGAWFSEQAFVLRSSARIVWASTIGIKLSSGRVVVVGDLIPRWKGSAHTGVVK